MTYDKKIFRPNSEAYFWHRDGASFGAWKVGIFTYFKSRFRAETWTPVVRLILITCEPLSRVTQCCVVMFMFLKKWLMFTGTKIMLWQHWKRGDPSLTCFVWQVCSTVPAAPVFCFYHALSVHWSLYGAFMEPGTQQQCWRTDKSQASEYWPPQHSPSLQM